MNTRLQCHDRAQIELNAQLMNNGMYAESRARLIRDAERCMQKSRISVVDKPAVPPSGNKHDYYSIAPYSWPNPDTPDGLPYVNRDGEFNPEFELCDRRRMDDICATVRTLSLAYKVTGCEKYRQHAIALVRCFFLDEETCMTPHLEFGQAIKGVCTGRGIGIIDIRYYYRMLDMLLLLEDEKLNEDMRKWLKELLNWLITSSKGHDESIRENNHGTWYDVTSASIAMFTGNTELAYATFERFESKRMIPQVSDDGSMPKELKRTRSYLYSTLNLYGYFMGACLAENLGINLWQSNVLRWAFDFMLPYYESYEKWNHTQIAENWEQTWEQIYEILHLAAIKYDMPSLKNTAEKLRLERIPDSDVVLFGR